MFASGVALIRENGDGSRVKKIINLCVCILSNFVLITTLFGKEDSNQTADDDWWCYWLTISKNSIAYSIDSCGCSDGGLCAVLFYPC